ncbi:MAG: hypothetical protein JNL66_20865 [Alphaproteobacteria bacterium]|nr:hypothetical protein [Alphaproteobacteria bacterium]
MRRSTLLRCSPLIVALYALAAITLGFAHRGALPVNPLAAFAAPDGTPAVICATDAPDQPGHHAGTGRDCDACRLAASPGLLPAGAPAPRTPSAVALAAVVVPHAAAPTLSIFRATSRGPPAGFSIV